ncbi:MAG: tetratricopeptide repeat protein [candidate division KSB1 bacterium]|nr:tetratricopeptide repeat protein [candidate division KSB1 bacterium]
MRYIAFAFLSVLLVNAAAPAVFAQGAGRKQVAEGNRYFAEGKFDEANNKYRDAQIDNPESPIIHFNIADALYKKRKYEEALESYRQAIQNTDDVKLQAQAYYNIGNTLYRLNKWPESILAYQQALKLDPNDHDAKYNLEYVRAKLKEQAQKQPQEQQQQQQSSAEQQNQPNDQQQKAQQEQNQQEEDQKEQSPQEQAQPPKQQQGREGQEQKDHEQLSKEDAARLLEALRNQEKEAQKQRQMKVRGRADVEKDW